jgi:GNAT superfamily N-acetyltransferase
MIVVRECRDEELECAKRVSSEAFEALRQVYRPSPQAVGANREIESALKGLVALDGTEVAGTVQYWILEDRLHLVGLAVRPCRQREGIALDLLKRLRELAGENGLVRLSLCTVEQTENVPVFQRLGLVVTERKPAEGTISVSGEALTDVYMERTV